MNITTEDLKEILSAASDMYSYNNEFDPLHFVCEVISELNNPTLPTINVKAAEEVEVTVHEDEIDTLCANRKDSRNTDINNNSYFECEKDEWGPGWIVFIRTLPTGKSKIVVLARISMALSIKVRDLLNKYGMDATPPGGE